MCVNCLTEKDMVKEMMSKMKNAWSTGPLGSVSEMAILIGEARNKIITGLASQV